MAMLNKLNEREKLMVIGAGVFLIVFFLGFIFYTIITRRNDLSEEISGYRSDLNQLDTIIKKYNYYKAIKSNDAEDTSKVYAKLDTVLTRYGLKGDRTTLKDFQSVTQKEFNKFTIEINMKQVRLNDVFKMIYDIEVNKEINSKVDYFTFVKALAGKEEYDVVMKISSYSRIKK
jgi:general secretion pathway protein M